VSSNLAGTLWPTPRDNATDKTRRITPMIHIAYCSIELHFPVCQSLKDKRMILKGLKDRLKKQFNIALAEEDYANLWQRSRIGIVTLSSDKQAIINIFDKIMEHIEQNGSIQMTNSRVEYF
jgi:uncharacterized protein